MRSLAVGIALTAALGVGCADDSSESGAGGSGNAGTGGGAGGFPNGGSAGWPSGGSAGNGGSAGLPELPCDDRFAFSKSPAVAGEAFEVTVTDVTPHAYVDVHVSGAGSPASAWKGMTGNGPWSWTWTISGHGVGVLDFDFVKDKDGANPGEVVASCQLHSIAGSGGSGGAGGSSTGPPPPNRYGIGYTHEGSAADHDLSAKLAGPGGWVTVIFADIKPGRTTAEPSWKSSIADAYQRDLIPVIRMAPPWSDRRVRNMGESPTSYKALAKVYADVISDLPKRDQWPLYVQVHNEPNLCYEWACDAGVGTLSAQQIATEYAHLLSDVASALHALGDARIRVMNAGLAPGGNQSCSCSTGEGPPGTLATQFLQYMSQAVTGVFDQIDAFASHSYPAAGEGHSFFPPYAQALPGLLFFEKELAAIGKPGLKVVITETGWTIQHEGFSHTRDQVADWSVQAYQNVWLTHPSILGVTPFILRDGAWDNFAWVQVDGTPYPVYSKVRADRCSKPGAANCQ